MQWELWDAESGNLIGWRESEVDALALVRELVGKGWPAEALSLAAEDDALPAEVLPLAVTGSELVRRAEESAAAPPRRR